MRALATTGGGKKSILLDGSTGYITTPFVPSGSCSIAVWAYLFDVLAAQCLFGTAQNGSFSGLYRVETTAAISFFPSTQGGSVSWSAGSATPLVGAFAFAVLTYDLAHATTYINGANLGSAALTPAWNGGALEFGARGAAGNLLHGYLYRMMAWDQYILTAGDVTALKSGDLSVARSNVAVEYLLKEGGGRVLRDTSGKGNNGTLVGGSSWMPLAPAA